MGYKLTGFEFVTGENEQIDATIKVPKEPRSMLHGVVMDCSNKVIKDAVVKLFKVRGAHHSCRLKPITHAFTDRDGQFMFGPLAANCKYVIKVWVNHVNIKELIIQPDDCNKDKCKKDRCHIHSEVNNKDGIWDKNEIYDKEEENYIDDEFIGSDEVILDINVEGD